MKRSRSAENLSDLSRLDWVELTLESPQLRLRRASLLSDMVITGAHQLRSLETPNSKQPEEKRKRVMIFKDDDNGSRLTGEIDSENWRFSDDKTGITGFYHRLPKFYSNLPVIRNIEEDEETIRLYFAKKGRCVIC
jgi:hypothetical protein